MVCNDCGTRFRLQPPSHKPLYIDQILETLIDGENHTLNELSAHPSLRKLSITNLTMILNFLAEYKFLELDEVVRGDPPTPIKLIKLPESVLNFLQNIQAVEKTEQHG